MGHGKKAKILTDMKVTSEHWTLNEWMWLGGVSLFINWRLKRLKFTINFIIYFVLCIQK